MYRVPSMHPRLVSTLKSMVEADNVQTVPLHIICNRRPFSCPRSDCGKSFRNPQTLRMHLKTHNTGDTSLAPLQLPPSHLEKRVTAAHNKKIPSRCPLCRKTFVGLYELRRHFGRKHSSGEKAHACPRCPKRFHVEVDLRDHLKLCGKPILCKCGLKFAFKCNFVAHTRNHPECLDDSAQLPSRKKSKSKSSCRGESPDSIPPSSSSSFAAASATWGTENDSGIVNPLAMIFSQSCSASFEPSQMMSVALSSSIFGEQAVRH